VQALERRRPVGVVAREQDHVMGAGHRADAVELEKAEPLDQVEHAAGRQAAARRIGEPLEMKHQAPGLVGGDSHGHVATIADCGGLAMPGDRSRRTCVAARADGRSPAPAGTTRAGEC
jgi:hypothetical protein